MSEKEAGKQPASLSAKLLSFFSIVVAVIGLLAAIEPVRDLFIHALDNSLFEKQHKGFLFKDGISLFTYSTGSEIDTFDDPIAWISSSWNANVRRAASLLKAPETRRDGLVLLAQSAKTEKELTALFVIAGRLDLTIKADAAVKLMATSKDKQARDMICIASFDAFFATLRSSELYRCLGEIDSASVVAALSSAKADLPPVSDLNDDELRLFATRAVALVRGCNGQSQLDLKACGLAKLSENPEGLLTALIPSKAQPLSNLLKILEKAGQANQRDALNGLSVLSVVLWPKAPDIATARRTLEINAAKAVTDLDAIERDCSDIGPATLALCSNIRKALDDCGAASRRWTGFNSPDALAAEMTGALARAKASPRDLTAQMELTVAKNAATLWARRDPQFSESTGLANTPEAVISDRLKPDVDLASDAKKPMMFCVGLERADVSFSAMPVLSRVMHQVRAWEMDAARAKGGSAPYHALMDQARSAIGERDYQTAISAYLAAATEANDLIQPQFEIATLGQLADLYRLMRDADNYEITMQRRAQVAAELHDFNNEILTYTAMRDQFTPLDKATRGSAIDAQFHSVERSLKWALAAVTASTRVGNAPAEIETRQVYSFMLCMAGRPREAEAQEQLTQLAASRLNDPEAERRVSKSMTCGIYRAQMGLLRPAR